MQTESRQSQSDDSQEQSAASFDNVDKIREILFGNQMKDFEHKFRQLQEQLNKDMNNLRDDSRMRMDSLENFVKSEFEALNQRLDEERRTSQDELEQSSEKLEKRLKTLDQKLLEHEKQSNQKARELRQLLLDQAREIFEQMNQKQADDREMLHRIRDELDRGKVDRSALSSLFTELAMQVSGNDFSADFLKDN